MKTEVDPAFAQRAQYIFSEIQKQRPSQVLDAGCGRGFYSHSVSLFPFINKIYGVDISDAYLKVARTYCKSKKVIFKRSSIYTLPFPDNYFDCIIFSEVLEHLSDEKKALNELNRVLKKGGTLLLTVPNVNYPFLWDPLNWVLEKTVKTHIPQHIWWLAGIWADHKRLYSQDKLNSLFEKNGFKMRLYKEIVNWCWPFSHFILYGVGKNMVERFNLSHFNRFRFSRNRFVELVAYLFSLPSLLMDKQLKTHSSVNLAATFQKNT